MWYNYYFLISLSKYNYAQGGTTQKLVQLCTKGTTRKLVQLLVILFNIFLNVDHVLNVYHILNNGVEHISNTGITRITIQVLKFKYSIGYCI